MPTLPKYVAFFFRGNAIEILPYFSDEEVVALIEAIPSNTAQYKVAVYELNGASAVAGNFSGKLFVNPAIRRIMEGRQ